MNDTYLPSPPPRVSSQTELRRSVRVVVNWRVAVTFAGHTPCFGTTVDISSDGLGMLCDFNLPVAACKVTLELRSPLPGPVPAIVEIPGRVVYSVCSRQGWRIGIEFKSMPEGAAQQLAAHIHARGKLLD